MNPTTTGEIESDIEASRSDLRSNFEELEQKVKSVTDWRQHFRDRPGTMLTAAFGAGALLAVIVGARKGRADSDDDLIYDVTPPRATAARRRHPALQHWDTIKSALVGVAATRFTAMLGDMIPGFHDHLAKTEGERNRAPAESDGPSDAHH
jgi:hypothetical protein